jgi:two-component system response regulator DesR
VHQGQRVIDPKLAAESWNSDADPLTPRQREILQLATEGASTKRIGAKLGISAGTVRNYVSEVISKRGAANRIEAGRIARGKGWL